MIGGRRRPDDIFIGFPPDVESVAGDGEAIAGELLRQVDRRLPQPDRRCAGMALAGERGEMGSEFVSHAPSALRHDLGADALAGKDFQQEGMGNAPVDNVSLSGSSGQRIEAGMNFRQHAFADHTFLHHPLHVFP